IEDAAGGGAPDAAHVCRRAQDGPRTAARGGCVCPPLRRSLREAARNGGPVAGIHRRRAGKVGWHKASPCASERKLGRPRFARMHKAEPYATYSVTFSPVRQER